jgi:hypothetical protein
MASEQAWENQQNPRVKFSVKKRAPHRAATAHSKLKLAVWEQPAQQMNIVTARVPQHKRRVCISWHRIVALDHNPFHRCQRNTLFTITADTATNTTTTTTTATTSTSTNTVTATCTLGGTAHMLLQLQELRVIPSMKANHQP